VYFIGYTVTTVKLFYIFLIAMNVNIGPLCIIRSCSFAVKVAVKYFQVNVSRLQLIFC